MLRIYLYEDPFTKTLDLSEISYYLLERLGKIHVNLREEFFKMNVKDEYINTLAKKLASIRIKNIQSLKEEFEPFYGEIELEKKIIKNISKPYGILYDGLKFMDILWDLIPPQERTLNNVHIIFTNRLLATWDYNDNRYHARVIICGFPSIISTAGIVEAPAKPKEYYLLKQKYSLFGNFPIDEVLKNEFKGRFIEYDDERLTEVLKGYVLQAIFYHVNQPFCEVKNCRFFNAHWQEEVIEAQLKTPEFCEKHEKVIKKFREKDNMTS